MTRDCNYFLIKQAQMCSDPPKRDFNHRCNHRLSLYSQFTLIHHFTETTGRLTH